MNNSAIRAFGIALFLVGALIAFATRFDFSIGLPTKASTNGEQVMELQKKACTGKSRNCFVKGANKTGS